MIERNDAVRERGCGIGGGGVRAAAGRTAARAVVRRGRHSSCVIPHSLIVTLRGDTLNHHRKSAQFGVFGRIRALRGWRLGRHVVFARGLRDVVGRFASLSARRNDDRAHFDTQTGSFAFLCSRTRRFGRNRRCRFRLRLVRGVVQGRPRPRSR